MTILLFAPHITVINSLTTSLEIRTHHHLHETAFLLWTGLPLNDSGRLFQELYHVSLQWRHNGPDSVSNHQPYDCSLNRLFRRRSNKTSKLRVTDLCAGHSPVTGEFPAQMASNPENVFIWWCHHDDKWLAMCMSWITDSPTGGHLQGGSHILSMFCSSIHHRPPAQVIDRSIPWTNEGPRPGDHDKCGRWHTGQETVGVFGFYFKTFWS